ncbi:hypothetical protein BG31_07705 [Bacillus subtilis subsp. subtilis]|nr:hypothetical protein BCM26_19405 [Bacillus subtilis]OTQ88555.1 hypothetical protein BG31_07705 [Bacillus subtilis subsp. subtilis]
MFLKMNKALLRQFWHPLPQESWPVFDRFDSGLIKSVPHFIFISGIFGCLHAGTSQAQTFTGFRHRSNE